MDETGRGFELRIVRASWEEGWALAGADELARLRRDTAALLAVRSVGQLLDLYRANPEVYPWIGQPDLERIDDLRSSSIEEEWADLGVADDSPWDAMNLDGDNPFPLPFEMLGIDLIDGDDFEELLERGLIDFHDSGSPMGWESVTIPDEHVEETARALTDMGYVVTIERG